MTDYFEVRDRDGPARLGELRLADPVATPALVDPVLRDAGSRWSAERSLPDGDEGALAMLPHRGFPAGTDGAVREAFGPEPVDVGYPAAAAVASGSARDLGVDAYFLSDAAGIVGHAAAFREAVLAAKAALPPDVAVGLAGVATPANVALLAYAGVDLVDTARARIRGSQGRYLTGDGAQFLEDLTEPPCSCPACQGPRGSFDREDCEAHNVNALRAELRRVRERIRAGRLRDYLEGQARHEPWLTAALREFDRQWGYVERHAPVVRDVEMTATSEETLRRPEIRRFADRVTGRYRCRFDAPLVLVPCSARKPYGDSQSHGQFRSAIRYRGHKVSMTSPIGVVPQELETTYPAQHYDAAVTGRWSETEIEFVAAVLARYLDRTGYSRAIAHVPPEGYREVCERAAERADGAVAFEFTVADHPTTDESLANLRAALEGAPAFPKREREHNTVRAIADYQFGDGAGDALFGGTEVTGRYPKLQVRDPAAERPRENEAAQLAAMVPQYGALSLTLAGGRRWIESDVPTRRVEIDGFVPHGSVLAPGVVAAGDGIRVGDEVVIEGPDAFAVGRARMPGPEMAAATRGVACSVRHVEER